MLLIRLITENDVSSLATMHARTIQTPLEKWSQVTWRALIEDWLRKQPDLCFLAEYNQQLAGALMVGVRPWWDGNHLVDGELFVDPQYQKQRIGTELFRYTVKQAISKYAPVAWDTYTFRDQQFTRDWYNRLGFKEIEEWVMIRADIKDLFKKLR